MATYRKKPVEIEAVQLRWDTWNEMCEFLGPDFFEKRGGRGVYVHGWFIYNRTDSLESDSHLGLLIPTLEGNMIGVENDWIIRGVKGELYPCKPDIFKATYEPV